MVTSVANLLLVLVSLLNLCAIGRAARRFDRRSDLDNAPPINASVAADWQVPLQGSRTCDPGFACLSSLSPPQANKTLQYLAIAKGVYMYLCPGVSAGEDPVFEQQSTQLYNVAPLVPTLPNEDALHTLTARLYDFDYAEVKNSTLECFGTIGTDNGTAVVEIFEVATFEPLAYENVQPPQNENPYVFNRMSHTMSRGGDWEVYRVETHGGFAQLCDGSRNRAEKEYTAEYWFYHSEDEDLWSPDPVRRQDSLIMPSRPAPM